MLNHMLPLRVTLAIAVASFAICKGTLAHGSVVYVRAGGNDANDGGSPATAVRTIRRGAALAKLGDRVVVGPGTYTEGDISPVPTCDDAGRVCIRGGVTFTADTGGTEVGDPPGDVVVDASGFVTGFDLNRALQMTIDGFLITGADIGIYVKTRSDTATISNNTVVGNRNSGIYIQDSSNVLISDNLAYDNGESGIQILVTSGQKAGNITVHNCHVYDNGRRGIKIKGASLVSVQESLIENNRDDGVQVGEGDQFVLRDCTVSNNGDNGVQVTSSTGAAVTGSRLYSNNNAGIVLLDVTSPLVSNNLVYANGSHGILISGNFVGSPGAQVLNNTIYSNSNRGILIGGSYLKPPSPSATVLRNIIQGNGRGGLQVNESSLSGYFGDYNLVRGSYGHLTPSGPHDILFDPLFVAPAGADGVLGGAGGADDKFQLSQPAAGQDVLSPAVDSGGQDAASVGMDQLTTRSDEVSDTGVVDLGYHYRAQVVQGAAFYVHPQGLDTNSGVSPAAPLQTIGEALRRARTGSKIHLAGGTYEESRLHPGAGVVIIGDTGSFAVVDATGAATAFDVSAPDVTIAHIAITGATGAGARVQADRFRFLGNRVFSNPGKGVFVAGGTDALLFDNLVYDNGNSGVVVGGNTTPAAGAIIAQNTVYGNSNRGITVGLATTVASPDAVIVHNLASENSRAGIEVGQSSLEGLVIFRNCNDDGYAGVDPPSSDILSAPLLIAPAGPDNILGGVGAADDNFRLLQFGDQAALTSPCVNAGKGRARQFGLGQTSTRTDGKWDAGRLDLGFHYGEIDLDRAVARDAVWLRLSKLARYVRAHDSRQEAPSSWRESRAALLSARRARSRSKRVGLRRYAHRRRPSSPSRTPNAEVRE